MEIISNSIIESYGTTIIEENSDLKISKEIYNNIKKYLETDIGTLEELSHILKSRRKLFKEVFSLTDDDKQELDLMIKESKELYRK